MCQHFIHSAASGKVSELKVRKLNFDEFLERIENEIFIPAKPLWLMDTKKRKRFDEDDKETDPSNNFGREFIPKKIRTDKVQNKNHDKELKIPSVYRYGQLFNPMQKKGHDPLLHDDGSEICNNWFFRGFCNKECKFADSHKRNLSSTEKEKCMKFLDQMILKKKKYLERINKTKQDQG